MVTFSDHLKWSILLMQGLEVEQQPGHLGISTVTIEELESSPAAKSMPQGRPTPSSSSDFKQGPPRPSQAPQAQGQVEAGLVPTKAAPIII